MHKETYWSRYAADYEKRTAYVVGKQDLDLTRDRVAAQEDLGRVLELGCGSGTYSRLLAARADHVLATDFSDAMVSQAKKNLARYTNVTVEKQNCLQIGYKENSFDTVFIANLLHVIPDSHSALLEAGRVLKPGGKAMVLSYTTKGMGSGQKLAMIFRYLTTYGKPPQGSSRLGPGSIRDMLMRTGFTVEQSVLIGARCKAVWAIGVYKKNALDDPAMAAVKASVGHRN